MAKQMAKYRIDVDNPGMQIAGAGAMFGELFGTHCGVIPPGTEIELPVGALDGHGGVRACMTPLNALAEQEFKRKREQVAAAWRESLPKGQNPDGQRLESLAGKRLSKDEIEQWVAAEIVKVGPNLRTLQREVKKKRGVFNPGAMSVKRLQPAKRAIPGEVVEEPEEAAKPGARASDQPS